MASHESPCLPLSLSPCLHVLRLLLHVRGGRSGGSVRIEIDEAAHEVRESSDSP